MVRRGRQRPTGVGPFVRSTLATVGGSLPQVSNVYFLVCACLNFSPDIAAFGANVAFIPLIFVLAVTASKGAPVSAGPGVIRTPKPQLPMRKEK